MAYTNSGYRSNGAKPTNQRYNKDSVTSIEMIKESTNTPYSSADASILSSVLASFYDGVSHTGVINPSVDRLLHQLKWNEQRFAGALAVLVKSGKWVVPLGTDGNTSGYNLALVDTDEITDALLSYGVLNIKTFHCQFIDDARRNKQKLKQQRMSLNYHKCTSRYTGLEGGLAMALQLWAVALTPPKFNDLGHRWYENRNERPPYAVRTQSGKIRKFFHSALFDHPMLDNQTPAGWEYLSTVTKLTDDMVSRPREVVIPVSKICQHFGIPQDGWDEVWTAVQEVNNNGWFLAKVINSNPFGNGMDGSIVFTPQKKLHDLVWDFDLHAGGENQTKWEAENGFLPIPQEEEGDDPIIHLPKAGYHWLYLLSRKQTGEWLAVGQTSLSLEARLFRHKTEGTNSEIDSVIREITANPDDELQIDCIGQVHYWSVHSWEMRALWKMQSLGHNMLNKVDTVEDNRRTIKLDRRLRHLSSRELDAFLLAQKEKYGDQIFLRELPKPGQADYPRWEPPEPPVTE